MTLDTNLNVLALTMNFVFMALFFVFVVVRLTKFSRQINTSLKRFESTEKIMLDSFKEILKEIRK